MVNPDLNEAARVEGVAGQAESDIWRGVKPAGVFANAEALAQDQKDYPEYYNQYNTKTTDTATAAEA